MTLLPRDRLPLALGPAGLVSTIVLSGTASIISLALGIAAVKAGSLSSRSCKDDRAGHVCIMMGYASIAIPGGMAVLQLLAASITLATA